jgi:cleavage and polyadenylation specificity factor subunit 1
MGMPHDITKLNPGPITHRHLNATSERLNCFLSSLFFMNALRQEVLPASGVEFATSLKLTPSTLPTLPNDATGDLGTRHTPGARALYNVVVARSNLLRVFEVREVISPSFADDVEKREASDLERKGTEAVEGEVVMDEGGEGFVNIGGQVNLKSTPYTICYSIFNEYISSTDAAV